MTNWPYSTSPCSINSHEGNKREFIYTLRTEGLMAVITVLSFGFSSAGIKMSPHWEKNLNQGRCQEEGNCTHTELEFDTGKAYDTNFSFYYFGFVLPLILYSRWKHKWQNPNSVFVNLFSWKGFLLPFWTERAKRISKSWGKAKI